MMTTTTIRVSTKTQQALRQMATTAGVSMQEVIEHAIELYRRKQLIEAANTAYAALRQNPDQWKELTDEHAAWDTTLGDGLKEG